MHLQIPLSTLLGLDERPATLPGMGPLPAAHAATLSAAQYRAPWRYAVTDPDGRLLRAGALRTRPARSALPPHSPTSDPRAPGLVDVIVDATLLADLARRAGLDPAPCPGTENPAPSTTDPQTTPAPAGETAKELRPEVLAAWRPVLVEILAARGRPLDDDPQRRFPHTGLRRHIGLRDLTCTFPGCVRPSRRTDLDHTREYARGGSTTVDDLGPACRHDHGLKDRGWRLTQPEPGFFTWRSPLGHTYRTRSEPLLPPAPPERTRVPDPADDAPHLPPDSPLVIWRPRPPRPSEPPAPEPPAPEPPAREPTRHETGRDDDPPPF
ncbi:MAG: HNH endonuclease [Pseudonocardia sp.]|nr:HNH endonuclease [Pseudonocardia sp.]